jgi:hypothetical protein
MALATVGSGSEPPEFLDYVEGKAGGYFGNLFHRLVSDALPLVGAGGQTIAGIALTHSSELPKFFYRNGSTHGLLRTCLLEK